MIFETIQTVTAVATYRKTSSPKHVQELDFTMHRLW